MGEEITLHAYVEGGGGLCSACGHSIGHDMHGKSMSGELPFLQRTDAMLLPETKWMGLWRVDAGESHGGSISGRRATA